MLQTDLDLDDRACLFCSSALQPHQKLFCCVSHQHKQRSVVAKKDREARIAAGAFGRCAACGANLKAAHLTFCSNSCAKAPGFHPRAGKIKALNLVCEQCGRAWRNPWRRKTCSPQCAEDRRRQLLSGRLTPNSSPRGLKDRLLQLGFFEAKCSECGIRNWRGKPAPLELDHVDGNNSNNVLDNLRILCANCHAQTDTYCGKNKGNGAKSRAAAASA